MWNKDPKWLKVVDKLIEWLPYVFLLGFAIVSLQFCSGLEKIDNQTKQEEKR